MDYELRKKDTFYFKVKDTTKIFFENIVEHRNVSGTTKYKKIFNTYHLPHIFITLYRDKSPNTSQIPSELDVNLNTFSRLISKRLS